MLPNDAKKNRQPRVDFFPSTFHSNFAFKTIRRKQWKNGSSDKEDKILSWRAIEYPLQDLLEMGKAGLNKLDFSGTKEEYLLMLFLMSTSKTAINKTGLSEKKTDKIL